ncbi:hypothetical protein QO228_18140 [Vibrio vulnificus]|uniref:hypothetical protein n=1 Tax=Vibrio vulnificus TaxID=672 RepID=UPI0024DFFFD8|nr:hypothetical protein [Vibrio vulnificus]MDK2639429.1 hypothetical protein [Vibrio vulnificus]MDK2648297.1 hypothetical protein [Vibrio vulnificus]MDK2665863.1 hypothetical protein [Vibrio vulnificus]MDK2691886.1 hypothetical protein [Vibrio vulnificus]
MIFFRIFLALLALSFVNVKAYAQESNWAIAKNNGIDTLSASGYINTSRYVLPLMEFKNPKSPIDVISNYFWRLKNNKIDGIEHLFYRKDGSFGKVQSMLERRQINFDQFAKVEEAEVVAVKKWGGLTSFDIKLKAKGERSFSWQQNVVCEKQCKLIWDLFDKNETTDMLELFLFTYLESNRIYGEKESDIVGGKNVTTLSLSNKYSAMVGGKEPRLEISLRLSPVNHQIEFKECSEVKEEIALKLCDIHNKSLAVNAEDRIELTTFITNLTGREDLDGLYVNEFSEPNVYSKFYGPHAVVQFITSWEKAKILGAVKGTDTDIILFRPIITSGKEYPIQALSYDKASKKLVYGSNWDQNYLFFYNNIFSSELERSL